MAFFIVMFFVRLYVKFGILLTYRLKDDFVLRSLCQAKKVSGPVFVFHDYRFWLFLRFFYWILELFRQLGIYIFYCKCTYNCYILNGNFSKVYMLAYHHMPIWIFLWHFDRTIYEGIFVTDFKYLIKGLVCTTLPIFQIRIPQNFP